MKKVLLFSLLLLVSTLVVYAYETVIFHFPDGEVWDVAYYKKRGNEAILQYVPDNQTSDNWKRTIVVHSYNENDMPVTYFSQNEMRKMRRINPTGKYSTIKSRENDVILKRCTEKYNELPAHCEFFRITKGHNGIITMQYMNRDRKDFENNYTLWLQIIRGAKLMESFYRTERTFNKSLYYEL